MQTIRFENECVCPSKVVCVGRNYLKHVEELGNTVLQQPVIFIKPNSAISDVLSLHDDESVDYEGELCFLVRNNQLHGVGFGLDLTKRLVQSQLKVQGLPWERAKAFDGSAVSSQFVRFDGDLTGLSIRLFINKVLVQEGHVKDMINPPQMLFAEAQTFLSFEDNDVLMTGTPEGVGQVNLGDVFLGQVFQDKALLVEQAWRVS